MIVTQNPHPQMSGMLLIVVPKIIYKVPKVILGSS